METILKSEIFFFITSISVIIFTVVFVIAGYYFIRIMKNLSSVSDSLKRTVDNAESNIGEISEQIKESRIFNFVFGKKRKTKAK